MEISKYLRLHARTIAGKSQFFVNSFAKALEVNLRGSSLLFCSYLNCACAVCVALKDKLESVLFLSVSGGHNILPW